MTDALFMTIFSGLWGVLILITTAVFGRMTKTIDKLSDGFNELRMDVALIRKDLGVQNV